MEPVLLVPVKAFADAKARLAPVLSPAHRDALARWTASRVLAAATGWTTFVACDDETVAEWAARQGAEILWHPGVGLNAAVKGSVLDLRRQGVEHVVIAHGDLPLPIGLHTVAQAGTITLVPDDAADGTNVLALPTATEFEFAYGGGSFRRHLAHAIDTGLPLAVRRDPFLSLDIDTPADLTHPRVQEVLPEWLPTNPANPTPLPR